MKSILLPPLFLLCSVAANAMDYKPVIQSLMNDVCSTSQNVSVCMYQFSAAVKAGKAIGENVELCKKVANEERAMLIANLASHQHSSLMCYLTPIVRL